MIYANATNVQIGTCVTAAPTKPLFKANFGSHVCIFVFVCMNVLFGCTYMQTYVHAHKHAHSSIELHFNWPWVHPKLFGVFNMRCTNMCQNRRATEYRHMCLLILTLATTVKRSVATKYKFDTF